MHTFLSDITREHGSEAVTNLATAYEATLLAASRGEAGHVPDRATRSSYVQRMLAEGRRNGFAVERLTRAALDGERAPSPV